MNRKSEEQKSIQPKPNTTSSKSLEKRPAILSSSTSSSSSTNINKAIIPPPQPQFYYIHPNHYYKFVQNSTTSSNPSTSKNAKTSTMISPNSALLNANGFASPSTAFTNEDLYAQITNNQNNLNNQQPMFFHQQNDGTIVSPTGHLKNALFFDDLARSSSAPPMMHYNNNQDNMNNGNNGNSSFFLGANEGDFIASGNQMESIPPLNLTSNHNGHFVEGEAAYGSRLALDANGSSNFFPTPGASTTKVIHQSSRFDRAVTIAQAYVNFEALLPLDPTQKYKKAQRIELGIQYLRDLAAQHSALERELESILTENERLRLELSGNSSAMNSILNAHNHNQVLSNATGASSTLTFSNGQFTNEEEYN